MSDPVSDPYCWLRRRNTKYEEHPGCEWMNTEKSDLDPFNNPGYWWVLMFNASPQPKIWWAELQIRVTIDWIQLIIIWIRIWYNKTGSGSADYEYWWASHHIQGFIFRRLTGLTALSCNPDPDSDPNCLLRCRNSKAGRSGVRLTGSWTIWFGSGSYFYEKLNPDPTKVPGSAPLSMMSIDELPIISRDLFSDACQV